jgi:CRP/FNR family transcriptional regulator
MKAEVEDKLKHFFGRYPEKVLKKGEVLLGAGENPVGIYFLEKGLIKVFTISRKGDEVVLNNFKPGAFFPMSWAINGKENKYNFEAVEESKIRIAPRGEAMEFLKGDVNLVWDLLERVYSGLEGMMDKMEYLMSETAYQRVVLHLVISAKRFGKSGEKGGTEVAISETSLASEAGLSRETVSRAVATLKKKKLVKVGKSRITISDLDKLEKEMDKDN